MARQKPPDEPEDDVPAWVMTFSDVITLLMTFFILLLTFASNQSESFDRMQVAMFGGGGATGVVGKADGMTKDALQMRERAYSGRTAPDGSEMPPIYSDPALSTLDKGISGLEPDENRVLSTTHHMKQTLSKIVNSESQLTSLGNVQLKLLSRQMRKRPLRLELVVHDSSQITAALNLAQHMVGNLGIQHSQVGVGVAPHQVEEGQILIIIANNGVGRGPEN